MMSIRGFGIIAVGELHKWKRHPIFFMTSLMERPLGYLYIIFVETFIAYVAIDSIVQSIGFVLSNPIVVGISLYILIFFIQTLSLNDVLSSPKYTLYLAELAEHQIKESKKSKYSISFGLYNWRLHLRAVKRIGMKESNNLFEEIVLIHLFDVHPEDKKNGLSLDQIIHAIEIKLAKESIELREEGKNEGIKKYIELSRIGFVEKEVKISFIRDFIADRYHETSPIEKELAGVDRKGLVLGIIEGHPFISQLLIVIIASILTIIGSTIVSVIGVLLSQMVM